MLHAIRHPAPRAVLSHIAQHHALTMQLIRREFPAITVSEIYRYIGKLNGAGWLGHEDDDQFFFDPLAGMALERSIAHIHNAPISRAATPDDGLLDREIALLRRPDTLVVLGRFGDGTPFTTAELDRLGLSRRQPRNIVGELEAAGLLESDEQPKTRAYRVRRVTAATPQLGLYLQTLAQHSERRAA